MKTYDVMVTRDGRWWMIEIAELDGLTQARRLDEVEKMAREYIAVTLDLPMSHVAVSISGIDVDGHDVLESKVLVDELRKRVKEIEEMAAAVTRELATTLTAASVPVRDVGKVLGLSHQRVSQIVRARTRSRATNLARAVLSAHERSPATLVVHLQPGGTTEVVDPSRTVRQQRVAVRKPAASISRSASRPNIAGGTSSTKARRK
jgi:hypothetical protein